MDFFEKNADNADTVKDSVQTSEEEHNEIEKLNKEIEQKEIIIKELFCKIGESYYINFINNYDESFNEIIADINNYKNTIDEYKNKIKAIEEVDKCKVCGVTLLPDAIFCSSCGARICEIEENIICSNCGCENNGDYIFCINCGNKLKEEDSKNCIGCGMELTSSMKFCTNCGTRVK